jgi:hypothetical protein
LTYKPYVPEAVNAPVGMSSTDKLKELCRNCPVNHEFEVPPESGLYPMNIRVTVSRQGKALGFKFTVKTIPNSRTLRVIRLS